MSRCYYLVILGMLAAHALAGASLYDQSIARVLAARYASRDVSYILIDSNTHSVMASRWDDMAEPVPVGSLVKPFIALAYGQKHDFRYPAFVCHGAADGCWLAHGHGRVDISAAIAYSCNAYFLNLASRLDPDDLAASVRGYGLSGGRAPRDAAEMIGLGGAWRVAPAELIRAYLMLAASPSPVGAAPLLRGMVLCARSGTAQGVDRNLQGLAALAKTGTAPCVHQPRAPGDGYVLMLYPADQPRLAMLVRVHGAPGAQAAEVGGRMLNTVVNGR
jgi:cell division protein FtsI/penicillin-binding protein 2